MDTLAVERCQEAYCQPPLGDDVSPAQWHRDDDREAVLDGSLAHDLFAVVGAPKAATTSLHHYLGQHPDVCMSIPKEPHFFDVFYSMGAKAYMKGCFGHRAGQPLVGECTTSSLALPFAPARIRAAFPEARIVACLREPLDRAYSAWRMHQRDGTESRSFEQAIQDNAERLRSGFHWHGDDGAARWRLMFEQYVRYGRLPAPTYLEFGQYGPHLQRYLEHFPRDRLAAVLFESLRRDTEQVVRRIWEFLEIQPGIVRRLDLAPRNIAYSSKRQPNLPADLKEWVARYYRDSNQLVEELLGIDVSAWDWDG